MDLSVSPLRSGTLLWMVNSEQEGRGPLREAFERRNSQQME